MRTQKRTQKRTPPCKPPQDTVSNIHVGEGHGKKKQIELHGAGQLRAAFLRLGISVRGMMGVGG